MIRLSAFADEISQDPVEQVDVLSTHGIKHIEFRAIHGTNVLDFSDDQHPEFRDLLRSRGFGLSAIGSPIGKIRITEPFDEHLQRFDRAMDLADFYQAPRIRIFSFYMPPGDDPATHRAEVMSRMTELARRSGRPRNHPLSRKREGNLRRHGRASGRRARDGRLAVSRSCLRPGQLRRSRAADRRSLVAASSFREALSRQGLRREDPPQRAGRRRRGQIPRLIGEAVAAGYDGFCVLEPHLVVAEQSFGFTGPERFADAANALKQILDERSIAYA